MFINSTYSVKIKHFNHIFSDTVKIYRDAVSFIINVCLSEWDDIMLCSSEMYKKQYIEHLIHATAGNPHPKYDFDSCFYKFPSYLLRGAIAKALGLVSSYRSNLNNWQSIDISVRGKEPSLPKAGCSFPCFYRDNMYKPEGSYTAKIKVYTRNTWDWISVSLRKSDADYITHHCQDKKMSAPVLMKRGKQWYLDFCFTKEAHFKDTPVFGQKIVAVDLGINSSCTCSVMTSDGAVAGRHFLKLPAEYDCLRRKTDHIKRAQRHGARNLKRLWKLADNVNHDISAKTASFIAGIARAYDADVIVFEHLDTSGKKKGSKKQKLALWRKSEVQKITQAHAHALGIHVSHVCAWGTSRLAFDGSGRVLRGKELSRDDISYSICQFPGGKIYNCDINASYNIGARYFIREIPKSLPERDRQCILAKVPECMKRSTCTLSSLIRLNKALCT